MVNLNSADLKNKIVSYRLGIYPTVIAKCQY